jgi:hypothetical protein
LKLNFVEFDAEKGWATCKYFSVVSFDTGFTRKHGLSVWAITAEKPPLPGVYAPPTANANTDDSFLEI